MLARTGILAKLTLLALVVLAGSACDVMFQGLNAQATDEWKRTYKLDQGGQIEVTNLNGMIDVSPSADATTVEVVAERRAHATTEDAAKQLLKDIKIVERAAPNRISLGIERTSTTSSFGRSADVLFHLKVPRDAAVKVSTRNGEVRVTGVRGTVQAESTNGGVFGEDLGGSVQAGTTNGSVHMQLAAVPREGVRLETVNGSIDLRVPAETKANISAHWANGTFEANGLNPEGERDRRSYEGKLNGGGPTLQLTTVNGRIRISSQER